MIACPRCGWLAEVENERAAWAEHIRDGFCAEVEPIRAPKRSPYRARLCIKGHPRDEFGNCPTCAGRFEERPPAPIGAGGAELGAGRRRARGRAAVRTASGAERSLLVLPGDRERAAAADAARLGLHGRARDHVDPIRLKVLSDTPFAVAPEKLTVRPPSIG